MGKGQTKTIKMLVMLVIMVITVCIGSEDGYAWKTYQLSLLKEGESIFTSEGKIRTNVGGVIQETEQAELKKAMRKEAYQRFIKGRGSDADAFPSSDFANEKIEGGPWGGQVIWGKFKDLHSVGRQDKVSRVKMEIGGKKYTFVIPGPAYLGANEKWIQKTGSNTGNYYKDWAGVRSSIAGFTELHEAMQQGFIAGSIETGYNCGSVYSDTQELLSGIMQEVTKMQVYQPKEEDEEGNKQAPVTPPVKTGLYEFKNLKTLKAAIEFFYNPIFGKMEAEDIPKDVKGWNEKAKEIDLSSGSVNIDSGYKTFANPNSDREGYEPVTNPMNFTGGVKAYKYENVTTKEPLQMINYMMRVVTPSIFKHKGTNSEYELAAEGVRVIDGIKMSLRDDMLYDISESENSRICTNTDLGLSRSQLALFKVKEEDKIVGAVVVLKYEEVVKDTRGGGGEIYYTGRDVVFGNNYSKALRMDALNRDVVAIQTKIAGKQGVPARHFAFDKDAGKTGYEEIKNHRILGGSEDFTFQMDFVGETTSREDANKMPYGFVIFRNNTYSQDADLMNWLKTQEAEGMTYVKAEELRKILQGDFGTTPLTFFEWQRMQEIKGELQHYKDTFMYRVINVVMIVLGVMVMIFGLLILVAYWVDVFNVFFDMSLLFLISSGHMYPISNRDCIEQIRHEKGDIRYVTFKDVFIIAAICWIVGALFLEANVVMSFIVDVYLYVMKLLGGQR